MMNTICYKLANPIIYNKGTKYESSHDTFLACYASYNDDKVIKKIERLNTDKNFREEFEKEHQIEAGEKVYFLNCQDMMY